MHYCCQKYYRNIETNLGAGPMSLSCNKTNNANSLHSPSSAQCLQFYTAPINIYFWTPSFEVLNSELIMRWTWKYFWELHLVTTFHLKFWNTAIIGIPARSLLYKVDRLLTGLNALQTTARWYSNKTSLCNTTWYIQRG